MAALRRRERVAGRAGALSESGEEVVQRDDGLDGRRVPQDAAQDHVEPDEFAAGERQAALFANSS